MTEGTRTVAERQMRERYEHENQYGYLLRQMLLLEILGEALYEKLAAKTCEPKLKAVFEKLAMNERQTAALIRQEYPRLNGRIHPVLEKALSRLSHFFFSILTQRMLFGILKTALRRRIYRRWFDKNKETNETFWAQLLDHETLQYERLGNLLDQNKGAEHESRNVL